VPPEPVATPFAEAEVNESEDSPGNGRAFAGWNCQVCEIGSNARLEYADMREDRVVFYASATRDVQQVVYRIKATNAGSYVAPPAYGEAMYDRGVIARSAAGRLTVIRP
jgi:alpha-2-macroglobulin